MRQFYTTFPISHTVCDQLSWSHYRVLMKVNDERARAFYIDECAKSNWSVRQLERQINTLFYERLLSSQDKDSVKNSGELEIPPFKPWVGPKPEGRNKLQ